ncbi:hypothetical protein [Desulfovirgula thermocuniculi]|uniref:hypothetical protein n=1 Tax=Desulfovirgula thermocuniculi TaxID=348842 RepID=UPI0012EBAEC2|nr:hypothetical protein [Desulfovirgula thermocuniculi]
MNVQKRVCPSCGGPLEPEACVVVLPGRGWEVVPGWRCVACRKKWPEEGDRA